MLQEINILVTYLFKKCGFFQKNTLSLFYKNIFIRKPFIIAVTIEIFCLLNLYFKLCECNLKMEVPAKSNAFQIKPDLENIIPPAEVKKLIQQTLNETLLSENYFL